MNLLLVALNQQGYKEIEPIDDKLLEADDRMEADWHGELRKGEAVNPKMLRLDVSKLTGDVVHAGLRNSVRRDELQEGLHEVTAYNDLTETIGRIKPEAEDLLTELDDTLLSAERLAQLFPQFTSLTQSLDLEQVIKKHAYFSNDIPLQAYLSALRKNKRMMSFCVENGLALLSIIVGDD